MTRAVLYVAHCLRPSEEEIAAQQPTAHVYSPHRPSMGSEIKIPLDAEMRKLAIRAGIEANLKRAMRWLSWLRRSFPETTFIAPWISAILSGEDDSDPKQREMGLVDACATLERCDGIVLCGPRISSGMRREMEHGRSKRDRGWDAGGGAILGQRRFEVYDLTGVGEEARDMDWIGGKQECPQPWKTWAEHFREQWSFPPEPEYGDRGRD